MIKENVSTESVVMDVIRESTGELVKIIHVFTDFTKGITVMSIPQYNAELRLRPTSRGSSVIIRRQGKDKSRSATVHLSASIHNLHGWGVVPFASHIFNTGRVELPARTLALLAVEERWEIKPS